MKPSVKPTVANKGEGRLRGLGSDFGAGQSFHSDCKDQESLSKETFHGAGPEFEAPRL